MKTIPPQLDGLGNPQLGRGGVRRGSWGSQKGFTLIELLGVAMIFGVLTFISLNLYHSFKARSQMSETQERLKLITAKLKQYYQTHERLPMAAGQDRDQVPVEPDALDMEQKYRLDAWGRYFRYRHDPDDLLNIRYLQSEGRFLAARILSDGPDQKPDTPDDVSADVDLSAEAKQITRNRLKLLQEKVAAYDALFPGIDNDGNGIVDDLSGLGRAAVLRATVGTGACLPITGFANDPSEGLATLDFIARELDGGGTPYNCSDSLIERIIAFYQLPESCGSDPWQNPVHWGYPGLRGPNSFELGSLDRRYHCFFSAGPDQLIGTDDDITLGGR